MRGALVVAVLTLAAGLLTHPAARAEPVAGSLLDATFDCAVELRGGVHLLEVRAHAGIRGRGGWQKLAYTGLRAGNSGITAGNMLAWITAGKPNAATVVDNEYDTFDVKTSGTAGIRRVPCRRVGAAVPLSTAGLRGGPVSRLATEVECFTSRRVLVRIRANLVTSGALRRGPMFHATHAPARDARLAVRTPNGKPLVYAHASQDGKVRLLTANGCAPQ